MARVENDSSEADDNEIEIVIDLGGGDHENDQDDSEDESITSDEEDDINLKLKADNLEEKISSFPLEANNHFELVAVLKKVGDLPALRLALDRLVQLTVLTQEQWLLWLETEVSLVQGAEDRKRITQLFERATIECFSVPIYIQWCMFSMGDDASPEQVRSVLKKATDNAGSDPLSGTLLWDTTKEYELALLQTLSEHSPEYEQQVRRVVNAFAEQLCRPLLNIDQANTDFLDLGAAVRSIVGEHVLREIDTQHERSREVLTKLEPFENQLAALNTKNMVKKKCEIYSEYIQTMKDYLPQVRDHCKVDGLIEVLYDRATYECAITLHGEWKWPEEGAAEACERLLLDSLLHAEQHQVERYQHVLERCTRRWPRHSLFWIRKMHDAESRGAHFDEIKTILESCLAGVMDTATDYVDVWMSYLEALRRHTDFESPEQLEKLRKTFRLAWDTLGQLWGDEADPECSILLYWARLEYQLAKDHVQGRQIFEEIFSYGDNVGAWRVWSEFLRMEGSRSVPASCRKLRDLHRRAVRSVRDLPAASAQAWLDHERDHGDLRALLLCQEEYQKILKEVASSRSIPNYWEVGKESSNPAGADLTDGKEKGRGKNDRHTQYRGTEHRQHHYKENKQQQYKGKGKGKKSSEGAQRGNGKAELGNKSNGTKRNSEKQSGTHANEKRRKLDQDPDQDQDERIGKLEEEDRHPKRKHPPVKSSANKATKRTAANDNTDNDVPAKKSRQADVSRARAAAPGEGMATLPEDEARTLFVSNLDSKFDEEQLRDKLCEFGEVESLRTVRGVKSFGGSICYCLYKEQNSVECALAHDRTPLDGRPVFLSRYKSKEAERKPKFLYSTELERNKLFVKNLSFSCCTEDKLREVFGEYGNVRDIRIVTHKDGRPKGLAYVEYEDERDATRALQAADGRELDGRCMDVAVSAPPSRSHTQVPARLEPAHALKGGRGRSRTQLSSFIPSVLQKATAAPRATLTRECKPLTQAGVSVTEAGGSPTEACESSAADSGVSTEAVSTAPTKLSNSDFRNLLLGKK